VQGISKILKEIIEDKKKAEKGANVIQEQLEDREDTPDPDNRSSVLSTVFNTIHHQYEHRGQNDVVQLLHVHQICQ